MSRKFLQNLIGALVSVGIGLVVVPFYIKAIGTERYGVLALVWVMLGFLGIFDLGMARSSTNALARVDERDVSMTARVFTTALSINMTLGLVGSLVIVFLGSHLILSAHALTSTIRDELQRVILWIAPILPLTLATGISIGALDARERFVTSNILQISSNAVALIVPLIVAIYVSPRLTAVIPALFLARLVTTVGILAFILAEFKTFRALKFDRSAARKLLHFGGWISVTNFVGPLMTNMDQFVIGSMLGVKPVAYYSVPMNAATRLQVFSTTLSRTLFPTFSRVGIDHARDVARRALVTLSFLSVLAYAPLLAALVPIFTVWLGRSFASSVITVAPILFVGAWINGLAIIPYSLIQGQGRPDLVAKAHVGELLPYLAALWLFAHWFGIKGVAVAWTLRIIADFVILWMMSKIPSRTLLELAPSLLLLSCGIVINLLAPYLNWALQFVCAAALLMIGLLLWPRRDPQASLMLNRFTSKLHGVSD